MTGFSILHLALAALAAFFALLNLLLWVSVRTRRTPMLLSLTFVAFILLDVGIAGSSVAAAPSESTVTWLMLGLLAGFIPAVLVQVAPLAFDEQPGQVHHALSVGLAVGWVTSCVVGGQYVLAEAAAHRVVTWEQLVNAPSTWMVWPFWVMQNVLGAVWGWHAVRALRAKPVSAIIVLCTTLPVVGLVFREMAMVLGLVTGPSFLGLAGLPIFFFSFANLGRGYVEAMRLSQDSAGLGRYRMIRLLGKGGMGELWLAARLGESGFTRYVAIKRILRAATSEEAVAQERFLAEARLAARLRHANIVSVYDLGKAEDGWFIVMEYLAGKSLAELREAFREGLDVAVAAAIVEQAARGLACAHRAGIIHRDVSPHNLMLTFEGVTKVVDFGVAKGGADEGLAAAGSPVTSTDVTRAGLIIGKRPYLSPEQLGNRPSSSQSDQWALAVVLYELLVGARPFDQETEVATLAAILQVRFTPPRHLKPEVPEAVERVILTGLSREPSERYRDLDEFARALVQAVSDRPPVDLGEWMRTTFPGSWAQERALGDGNEVTPAASAVPRQLATPGLSSSDEATKEGSLEKTAAERAPKP